MRRKLLFIMLFPAVILTAQVPNSSFEDWLAPTLPYESVEGYITSNVQIYYRSTVPHVLKTNGVNGNAMMIETDLVNGKVTNGNIWMDGDEGESYTEKPDSFVAVVKHNVPMGEQATIRIEFSNNGTLVAFGQMNLEGDQPDFIRVAAPITSFVQDPDLVNIVIKSSQNHTKGSTLTIDEIELIGATQQLTNHDFENWFTQVVEDPFNYLTYNLSTQIFQREPSVKKVDDAFSGDYALELSTRANYVFGQRSINSLIQTVSSTPGARYLPLEFEPDVLKCKYKYSSTEVDSAIIIASFFDVDENTGNVVGLGAQFGFCYANDEWTDFNVDLDFMVEPDSFAIAIAADAGEGFRFIPQLGRTLTLDDLELDMSTSLIEHGFEAITAYPNPATDWINIDLGENINQSYQVRILNGLAQTVRTYQLSDQKISLQVGDLPEGPYTILVDGKDLKYFSKVFLH